MKRIRPRHRRRINRRSLRQRLRPRLRNLQQRQILNRPRPRQLKIFQPRHFLRPQRALRKRHRQKRHVPQQRRHNRPPRPPRLDPAILKKSAAQKSFNTAARQHRPNAAPHSLVEIAPCHIQPRPLRTRRQTRSHQRHRHGRLPQQIQRPIGRTQTHSVATQSPESLRTRGYSLQGCAMPIPPVNPHLDADNPPGRWVPHPPLSEGAGLDSTSLNSQRRPQARPPASIEPCPNSFVRPKQNLSSRPKRTDAFLSRSLLRTCRPAQWRDPGAKSSPKQIKCAALLA